MAIVLVSFGLIFLAGFVLTIGLGSRYEAFGAQGGEMVQLAAGHVPTMEDVTEAKEERRQMMREIASMTGGW